MKERETILELCRKIKALADRGIAGEQHVAQDKLHKLLKHHGLTLTDLQNTTRTTREFVVAKRTHVSILHHVALHYGFLPPDSRTISFRRRLNKTFLVQLELTEVEYRELSEIYLHYINELNDEQRKLSLRQKQERKMFIPAFINRHSLFPPESDSRDSKPLTLAEHRALMQMMNSMESTDYTKPVKQLEGVA